LPHNAAVFIGHFAVAFAAKRAAPELSLGTLFLAAQLADLVWPTLVMLGVESVAVAPVPWFPFKSERFGDYAKYARTPREETRNGIRVLHPRYPLFPKLGMNTAPALLAAAALPSLQKLIRDGYDFDLIDELARVYDEPYADSSAIHLPKPLRPSAKG